LVILFLDADETDSFITLLQVTNIIVWCPHTAWGPNNEMQNKTCCWPTWPY